MDVAYDGTDFRGFAPQRDVRTVSTTLLDALNRILGGRDARIVTELSAAGRTDAGVHAVGQVISFSAPDTLDPLRVTRAMNLLIAPEITVKAIERAAFDFDARRSAQLRTYRYTIETSEIPDPFNARVSWWLPGELDVEALQQAAGYLVGTHDFATFCRQGPRAADTMRRVVSSAWEKGPGGILVYEITGYSFCWQMVRSIVGTLVDVGQGKAAALDVKSRLAAQDRSLAKRLAPPRGLCLVEVTY